LSVFECKFFIVIVIVIDLTYRPTRKPIYTSYSSSCVESAAFARWQRYSRWRFVLSRRCVIFQLQLLH